jgi:hypothetical protein
MLLSILAVATSADPMTRLVAQAATTATTSTPLESTTTFTAESITVAASGGDVPIVTFPVTDIMKPPPDDREYLVDMLENGLRVVYCSDPSSNEAGAAMDVHVGACSDPKDIPGLAHVRTHWKGFCFVCVSRERLCVSEWFD